MDSWLILYPLFLLFLLVCRSLTRPSPPVCLMIRVLAGCDVAFLLYSKCEVDKVLKSVMLSEPSPVLTSPPLQNLQTLSFLCPSVVAVLPKTFLKTQRFSIFASSHSSSLHLGHIMFPLFYISFRHAL